MKQKVTKDNWEALIHWNFALVGGFLGVYAILLHMGNFGSAQTGNIMEMAASLVSGEWYDVLLRFLALPLFGGGVVVSYILTNHTNINMRKLAILVDAAGLVVSSLLPLKPVLVGLYPIFFCSAFQWGVYSSANGYNSSTIFSSNNFKQAVLGWTGYFVYQYGTLLFYRSMLWCGSSQCLCGARGIPWLCAAGNRMDSGSKTQHGP